MIVSIVDVLIQRASDGDPFLGVNDDGGAV